MLLNESICKIRQDANMSQEKFAEVFEVSRQSVQKWEMGTSIPDTANLVKMAKKFGLSLDALLLNSGRREAEINSYKKVLPHYAGIHDWELYSSQLDIELRQCIDEGKNIAQYSELIKAVSHMSPSEYKEKLADTIFTMIFNAPQVAGYEFVEPSDYESIALLSEGYSSTKKVNRDTLAEKIKGAWTGRVSGCFLGKILECIKSRDLKNFLKDTNNYPLKRYIVSSDVLHDSREKYKHNFPETCFADVVQKDKMMPADDDSTYTLLGQLIIENFGKNFTPQDVASFWLTCQTKNYYCTAERVAYKNLVNGYLPPNSAVYKNPYREWIGAQIRADYFGYVNPGDPTTAANMAWRDASISHVKNGIYGEMFVAAAIATAAVSDDIIEIINGGLSQIPTQSRLHKSIRSIIDQYNSKVTAEQCVDFIHGKFDDYDGYDWCHTISNAMIVCYALLYGNGDFGKSICLAVELGYDTDCNGATVGSIMGMRNGIKGIADEWKAPIEKGFKSFIMGHDNVYIDERVEKTLQQIDC